MYIVAGLPPEVARRTENSLNNLSIKDLPRAIYHVPSFSYSDDSLYISEDYFRLKRDIASIVISALSEGKRSPRAPIITPSRIFLIFVPCTATHTNLLQNFEFFVYPIMMPVPTYQHPKWRHNPDLALDAVVSCIRHINEHAPDMPFVINEVSQRLAKTALTLPVTNFHEKKNIPLKAYFKELAIGGTWKSIEGRLKTRRYTKEDLPGMTGIGRRGIRAFTDVRGLIFAPPPRELWHAVLREPRPFSNHTALHNKMNEMYRLGVPVSEGFHYDTQLRGGKRLGNIQLLCCEHGKKNAADWVYANIYPNDFVRGG